MSACEVFDARFASVARGAGDLERLAGGAIWSEGPVWLNESGELLWSDIPNNRMLAWHAQSGLRVWRDAADFTNGHTREADGSLLHCSHGQRAIVRTRLDAKGRPVGDEVVVDRYQGRRLNSPNDIVVKRDGTIWFTDPPYGILSDREGHAAPSELGKHYVFRFCPTRGVLRIVSDFVEDPNGLAFSPDESLLYVSDTSAARREGGNHQIVVFDVIDGQDLANPRVFAVIEPGLPDGFRVDVHGFIYTSSEDSVQVYHPDGTRIGRIAVPEKVGNLCFGGPERNGLYICASSSVYRIRLGTRGVGHAR
jgi:gluconolactonase